MQLVIDTLKREKLKKREKSPVDHWVNRQLIYSIFAEAYGWTPNMINQLYPEDLTAQLHLIIEKRALTPKQGK